MRYFYLDNLRALLMVLGLVLHTCAAFSPSKYWLVSYLEPIEWVGIVNDFIHLFRMPLFFMISGFFAFIMVEKQNIKLFCSTKVLRIGLPFLSVLVLINLPQYILLDFLSETSISQQINTNSLVGHLWFLVNLLAYFLMYTLIHSIMNTLIDLIKNLPSIAIISMIILLVPFLYLGLLALNKLGIPIYKDVPLLGSIHKMFAYFDYFLIGSLIARIKHQVFIDSLLSRKGAMLLVFLLFISSIPWLIPKALNVFTIPYLLHIQAIFVSILIWLGATKVLNKNSGPFKYLADASYSIYLFHHGIIVLLVLFANFVVSTYKIDINAHMVFILIISAPLVITMLIHNYIVKKSTVLSFLFNGRTLIKS